MTELRDIMAYIIMNYPYESDLSNARVTKIIYLADWKHAITCNQQISPIKWYFDNYGPFVWDIKDTAESNPDLFAMQEVMNIYGSPKTLLSLKNKDYIPNLSKKERKSINHVIEKTKALNWDQFIRLVYSTYPIVTSEKYSYLDLIEKAREYQKEP